MFNNIEAERARHRMTKLDLAQHLGVTERTVYNWIHQYSDMPCSAIIKLSQLWNCSIDYLLSTDEKKENQINEFSSLSNNYELGASSEELGSVLIEALKELLHIKREE